MEQVKQKEIFKNFSHNIKYIDCDNDILVYE